MNPAVMRQAHRSNDHFMLPLQAGQALTLLADQHPRALWVHEGRVWLTRRCMGRSARACSGALPPDVVLAAGQSHTLPAGSEWVLEAWPAAHASVVQVMQPARAASGLPGAGAVQAARLSGFLRRAAAAVLGARWA